VDLRDYEIELARRQEAERERLVRSRTQPRRDMTLDERVAELERRMDQMSVFLLTKRT
jgi:hypothetical protein